MTSRWRGCRTTTSRHSPRLSGSSTRHSRERSTRSSSGAFFAGHQYTRAIADYDRAIELDPKNAEAYFFRARVYGNRGEREAAIENLWAAHERAPDNPIYAQALKDLGLLE